MVRGLFSLISRQLAVLVSPVESPMAKEFAFVSGTLLGRGLREGKNRMNPALVALVMQSV